MVCCYMLQHGSVAVVQIATVADMHVVCRLLLVLCRFICAHLLFRPAFMLIDHLPLGRCSGNTTVLVPPARGTRPQTRSARLPSVPRTLRPSWSAEQRSSTETAAFLRNWLGQGKPEETAQADAASTIEQTLLQQPRAQSAPRTAPPAPLLSGSGGTQSKICWSARCETANCCFTHARLLLWIAYCFGSTPAERLELPRYNSSQICALVLQCRDHAASAPDAGGIFYFW